MNIKFKQFKNEISNLWNIQNIFFKLFFKNIKNYIFYFVLPIPILFVILFYWTKLALVDIYPPMLMNFLFISIGLSSIFFLPLLYEWKNSVIFQRMKMNGATKIELIFSIVVLYILINLISISLNIIFLKILEVSFSEDSKQIEIKYFLSSSFEQFDFYSYFFSYIGFIFASLIMINIILIILYLFKSKGIGRISIILLFIFTIFFSDILINTILSSRKMWMIVIGYFSPFKYTSWFNLYINSYANIDKIGLMQIVDPYDGINSFKYMWIPTTIMILISFTVSIIAIHNFNFSRR